MKTSACLSVRNAAILFIIALVVATNASAQQPKKTPPTGVKPPFPPIAKVPARPRDVVAGPVAQLRPRAFPAVVTVILQNPRSADVTVRARFHEKTGAVRNINVQAASAISTPDDFDMEAKIAVSGPGRVEVSIPADRLGSWGPAQFVDVTAHEKSLQPLAFRFRLHASTDPPEQLVKVLTYNAQFYPAGVDLVADDRGQDDYRIQEIARRVKDYDIVILNEVFHDAQREKLIRTLKGHLATAGKSLAGCGPTDEDHSLFGINLGRDFDEDGGTIILTHFPIVERHQHVFRDYVKIRGLNIGNEAFDGFANKGVLHARIQRVNSPLDVFATHLQAGSTAECRAVRRKQLAKIRDFVKEHNDRGIPCLVTGDMNTRSDGSDYREMLAILREARPFDDVWTFFPATASALGATNNPLVSEAGERIDYILYSAGSSPHGTLVPRGVSVMPFHDPRVRSLSDHSGVLATFRWQAP